MLLIYNIIRFNTFFKFSVGKETKSKGGSICMKETFIVFKFSMIFKQIDLPNKLPTTYFVTMN